MSCGVGRRCGLDLALLWLWYRPAAEAPIQPLAWEPPYAAGVDQEMAKRPKKKKKFLYALGNVCEGWGWDDQVDSLRLCA